MGDVGERMAALERYAEMLAVLTPKQLVVVALRLEGLNNEQIAGELGINRKAVHNRLKAARRRLLAYDPDLVLEVAARDGRRVRHRYPKRAGVGGCAWASATAGE